MLTRTLFSVHPIPDRLIPITHDLVHLAAIHAAGLRSGFFDEMAKELRARPKRSVVDVTVNRLVHTEDESRHRLVLQAQSLMSNPGFPDA
jgi:hypothetical protein